MNEMIRKLQNLAHDASNDDMRMRVFEKNGILFLMASDDHNDVMYVVTLDAKFLHKDVFDRIKEADARGYWPVHDCIALSMLAQGGELIGTPEWDALKEPGPTAPLALRELAR